MKEEQNLELFQEIIDKLLQKKSLTDVETTIVETDTEFHAFQKEFTLISKAIKKSALHKKLDEIKELENTTHHKVDSASANIGKPKSRRSWLITALIIFLLGIAYLILQLNKGGTYDKDLIRENYIAYYPDIDAKRGVDTKVPNKAYLHYKKGDLSLAIKEFEKLMITDNNPKHHFYLGICLLETKKYKAAQQSFQHESLKNYKRVPINYYLAISKIMTDDPDEAIELLSNPTLSPSILDEDRTKLLRILRR